MYAMLYASHVLQWWSTLSVQNKVLHMKFFFYQFNFAFNFFLIPIVLN